VKADARNIDAVIAHAMACERPQVEAPVARLLGWV
jgi:hypothetical protein